MLSNANVLALVAPPTVMNMDKTVLFHWFLHPDSVSLSLTHKPRGCAGPKTWLAGVQRHSASLVASFVKVRRRVSTCVRACMPA